MLCTARLRESTLLSRLQVSSQNSSFNALLSVWLEPAVSLMREEGRRQVKAVNVR